MKKMRTYHRHIGAALLLAMATLSACVSEVIATSERTVSATFDELDTRVSLWPHEQSLDLTPAWQQEDMIRVFLRDGGTYHDLSSVPVRSISGDGKGCLFSYTIPGDMSGSEGLREICFTDAANPVLEDGRIYYGASLVRAPLERFRAPVLLDHPVAEGKDAKFRHYMTYELLHVKNETGADITFSHCGFVSERKWYRESGAYCLDTGDFTEGSSAAVPAAGRSEALTIPAGGTGIVISAYVPSGERIAEAQLLADIDGERIVSYNRKSSSAELRTGRAYHMYASWDGSKLTFRNGAFEETGDGQAEMHVGVPVDLGLSVKWAGWNVGASAPEIFGNHYAWGEYLEKSTYGWENYSLCEGTNRSLTKYGLDASFGKVDGKEVLEPMNDAATVN
ncbi:MAG: hypothetical protein II518_04740, partial [Candidatus Methanomethylophilus sp.]|nr:hypothetical protein [Methanomethylophilus sp.]